MKSQQKYTKIPKIRNQNKFWNNFLHNTFKDFNLIIYYGILDNLRPLICSTSAVLVEHNLNVFG